MSEKVIIDRDALADLVKAVEILTQTVKEKIKYSPLTEEEENKMKYVNKLVLTSMASFENNNP